MTKLFRVNVPSISKTFYVEAPSALAIHRMCSSIPRTCIIRLNVQSKLYDYLDTFRKYISVEQLKNAVDYYEINKNIG